MIDYVAIVGACFSGTLWALNFIRFDDPRATLIKRAQIADRESLAVGRIPCTC